MAGESEREQEIARLQERFDDNYAGGGLEFRQYLEEHGIKLTDAEVVPVTEETVGEDDGHGNIIDPITGDIISIQGKKPETTPQDWKLDDGTKASGLDHVQEARDQLS